MSASLLPVGKEVTYVSEANKGVKADKSEWSKVEEKNGEVRWDKKEIPKVGWT